MLTSVTSLPEINPRLIEKYSVNGPRYTSYPTADRFIEAYNENSLIESLQAAELNRANRALSLYLHIPFCKSLCYYCACNKSVTKKYQPAVRYLESLKKEIDLYKVITGNREVQQMHFGGGSPTFLTPKDIEQLVSYLQSYFPFSTSGEYSIEVDPRTVDNDYISHLAYLGFNRMSIGIQDFDPNVQEAINRKQSFNESMAVLETARRNDFHSINIDLIYGLPKQSIESFDDTLNKVLYMVPDRIALYNYAHLPQRFKPQRLINESDLPSSDTKLRIFLNAINRLTDAGYQYIGMDHFALPGDDLCIAQRQGRLLRNFQGYTTRSDCDLIGLGVSAIGAIGPTYYQNHRILSDYYDSLDQNNLPVMQGIALNADDLLRRTIIQSLMCNFFISIEAIETAHLINFKDYFSTELKELASFADEGLLEIDSDAITVKPLGRFFIRNICMVFDSYLRTKNQKAQYSKIL
jgi:oxygen-independent coproporphyrinogen-3 oxidase